jgi:hypothetical protein
MGWCGDSQRHPVTRHAEVAPLPWWLTGGNLRGAMCAQLTVSSPANDQSPQWPHATMLTDDRV